MADFFFRFFSILGFLWVCFLTGYFLFGHNSLPEESDPSDV